jgi:hypothetical protein
VTVQSIGGYQIEPTIQQVDAEVRDCSHSLLERWATAFDPSQIGAKSWEVLDLQQRRAMRAQNELARRKGEKERAEKKAAEEKRSEEQQNALVEAKIAAFRQQARGAWIGDQASFDRAWPRLMEEWQIDQVRATMDRNMAEVRGRVGGF